MRSKGIKAQDVLIILKLITRSNLSQIELSSSLSISQAEVSHALQRLRHATLLTSDGKLNREACSEFIIHGLKYIFPPVLGPVAIGIPTAHARPGFKYIRHAANDFYVWPHPQGKVKSSTVLPFYETLPEACLRDERLYSLASLVEMIRTGRAREQEIAKVELKKIIMETE